MVACIKFLYWKQAPRPSLSHAPRADQPRSGMFPPPYPCQRVVERASGDLRIARTVIPSPTVPHCALFLVFLSFFPASLGGAAGLESTRHHSHPSSSRRPWNRRGLEGRCESPPAAGDAGAREASSPRVDSSHVPASRTRCTRVDAGARKGPGTRQLDGGARAGFKRSHRAHGRPGHRIRTGDGRKWCPRMPDLNVVEFRGRLSCSRRRPYPKVCLGGARSPPGSSPFRIRGSASTTPCRAACTWQFAIDRAVSVVSLSVSISPSLQ